MQPKKVAIWKCNQKRLRVVGKNKIIKNMKAVITADIINSTKVLDERRNLLPTTLDNVNR